MNFHFLFYNLPGLATFIIKCGIEREHVYIVPKDFIHSDHRRGVAVDPLFEKPAASKAESK